MIAIRTICDDSPLSVIASTASILLLIAIGTIANDYPIVGLIYKPPDSKVDQSFGKLIGVSVFLLNHHPKKEIIYAGVLSCCISLTVYMVLGRGGCFLSGYPSIMVPLPATLPNEFPRSFRVYFSHQGRGLGSREPVFCVLSRVIYRESAHDESLLTASTIHFDAGVAELRPRSSYLRHNIAHMSSPAI